MITTSPILLSSAAIRAIKLETLGILETYCCKVAIAAWFAVIFPDITVKSF